MIPFTALRNFEFRSSGALRPSAAARSNSSLTLAADGVAAARHALWYQIGDYTGEGMLPLLLLEMRMALMTLMVLLALLGQTSLTK